MSPPRLPGDILLEIVALSDVTTAIRCTATCTHLRNAILDPGFHHRLHLRAAAANGGGAFDPARLLAVSYSCPDYGGEGVINLRRPRHARLDTSLLRSFEAISSRDGLLVLYRKELYREELRELRVCNALTGAVTKIPHMDVLNHKFYGGIYRPALLAVGAAGQGSFELLVTDVHLRVQIFSSSNGGGACGAVCELAPPPGHERLKPYALHTSPAVIGRAVYYLCNSRLDLQLRPSDDMFVLAVHADDDAAAAIELPEGWLGPGGAVAAESCCLGVTADGRMSVLVADAAAVRVWALSPEMEEGWSLRATIDRWQIDEQVAAPGLEKIGKVAFQGFGERSGAALLRIDMVGLVLLDIETEEAVLLLGCNERDKRTVYLDEQAWLHEVDLASLLQGMKPMEGIGDQEDEEEDSDGNNDDEEDSDEDDNEEEEDSDEDDDDDEEEDSDEDDDDEEEDDVKEEDDDDDDW
ncbi:unnamed protein product [Urochloa humidicola]